MKKNARFNTIMSVLIALKIDVATLQLLARRNDHVMSREGHVCSLLIVRIAEQISVKFGTLCNYVCCAIGGLSKLVVFNFVKSVITLW